MMVQTIDRTNKRSPEDISLTLLVEVGDKNGPDKEIRKLVQGLEQCSP